MNQVTIRNVDDHIVQGLKQIAWRRGVPFDESLRRLLSDAVEESHGKIRRQHAHAAGIATKIPFETD
jgi:plasmid stability protein